MGRFSRSRHAHLMVSAAVGALTLGSGAAWAQTKPITVAPQALTSALNDFGIQTGQQVFFTTELTGSKASQGVAGATDEQVALAQILQGTGLTFRRQANAFIIEQQGEGGRAPQSGSAAGGGAEVEALIVTAQKREEDIQDVPIAISAFTQEDLERSQIAGGPDLITQVPNMTFTKTNFTSYTIQIRGIGTQAISATTDPAVAVAFNNTPFVRNRFFEQEFYDLQRVEVLRGPQGTLYGRNATAGVVNIISQKPKFLTESKLSGDIANFSSTRLEGMVNIPLVEDKVALRIAGAWTKREGYATNELTGNPIDGRDLWSTRLSLRFVPTDALDATLIWEHFEERDDRIRSGKQLCHKHVVTQVGGVQLTGFGHILPDGGQSGFPAQSTFSQGCIRESLYSPRSFETPNGLSIPYYFPLSYVGLPRTVLDPYVSSVQSQDLRVIESTVDPKYKAMADLGQLQVNWRLTDHLGLTSETSYSADFVWSTQDFNRFSTIPHLWDTELELGASMVEEGILDENGFFTDPQVGRSDRLTAVDLSTGKSRQFSEEIRLASDYDGPFNFSLGANFLRFDGEDKYYVFVNSLTLSRIGDRFSAFDPVAEGPSPIPWIPGVSDNRQCKIITDENRVRGVHIGDPTQPYFPYQCVYIEPNSIENIQDIGHNYFLSKNPYRLISYAVFGEVYYNITDALKVTAGLRWTVDKKHAPRIPSWTLAGDGTIGYPVLEIIDQEWREPTGRLTVDWKPDLGFTDETLLYASYAHGYKAGGANPPPMVNLTRVDEIQELPSATRPKTFEAEFIDAFELGAKNTLFEGAVTLNLAAFYYDYTDYQISEIVDRSAFNRNFDAKVWGVEVEADWRPMENLKLSFKGGYENTRIADGEQAVDLMDRTAGEEGWVVVRPFPTSASSCVLPTYVFERPNGTLIGPGAMSGGNPGACEIAYIQGLDPVTEEPYTDVAADRIPRLGSYPDYQGFDPFDASQGHNFGEGFYKQIGGNELPNAPNWTATLSADYTVPLPNEWLATLHTDLYWQADSWWRVFDDHEFNRLDEYFTMNAAAIFTNEDAGWKVMAYVKNVLDRDSITGAFLNSDDTGLTTNVFLTEPRLYGLRVTKEWASAPFSDLFGPRREGPYPFTVELGGQVQRHDADRATFTPTFIDAFSDELQDFEGQHQELDWGDGRDVKLTWQPNAAWKASVGLRYGRTNGAAPLVTHSEFADEICMFYPFLCSPVYDKYPRTYENYSVSSSNNREEHMLVDFAVGMEVGIGGLSRSILSGGLRYADIESETDVRFFGTTGWDIDGVSFKYGGFAMREDYEAQIAVAREFKGVGPVLSWEASQALAGGRDTGTLELDWSLSGGVLFGKRETSFSGEEVAQYFASDFGGYQQVMGPIEELIPNSTVTFPRPPVRSDDISVPTFGASVGLSYQIDRFRIGAGYRWERYQNAIDAGGYDEPQEEDRTIDGPYLKVSLGFGG